MKKIAALIVVLLIAALGFVYLRLGAIAKSAIESYGSKAVGAPVKVGLVIVSPFSGKVRVKNLSIGNPPGFKSPAAFRLGDLQVALDLASLRGSGPVVVESVLADGVEVVYESGTAGSNLSRIQKNVAAYAPTDPEAKKSAGRSVKIALFRATSAKARLLVPQLGQDREVALPDLQLKDLDGSTKQVVSQLLSALAGSAVRAAGGAGDLIEEAKKVIPGALKDLFK